MDPQMWANLITGSGGALVVLGALVYSFAKGYIVRGSEKEQWRIAYEELNKKYLIMLEEKADTAEKLASSLRARAREPENRHE